MELDELQLKVNALVDEYRDRCLWFLRADWYPTGPEEILRALNYIRKYGDRQGFQKASKLAQCLSARSRKPSVA